jgi:hypothetical protein
MGLIVDETGAFFRIRECTRNEFIAVGSDGNICRWKETGGDEQAWLVIPLGGRSYRIMTKQNGEYMAVGSNGNILRWGFEDKPTQVFRLVNGDTDTFNIQEGTKNEFITVVDPGGNVRRWEKTNKKDQQFKFEPWKDKAKPKLPKPEAEPGQIGDVPRLTSYDFTELPVATDPKIVAYATIPATAVDDDTYSDKIAQMESNPYYVMQRSQYWTREGDFGYSYEHQPGDSAGFEKIVKFEVTAGTTKTVEKTMGTKFSVNGGFTADGSRQGIPGKMSAEMAYETSQQLKTTLVSSESVKQSEETRVTHTYDKNLRYTICGWSLIDVYTLFRADLKTIVCIEKVGSKGVAMKTDQYPSEVPPPTLS